MRRTEGSREGREGREARVVYLSEDELKPNHDDRALEVEIVKKLAARCTEAGRSISLALATASYGQHAPTVTASRAGGTHCQHPCPRRSIPPPPRCSSQSPRRRRGRGRDGVGAWPAHTYSWIRPPTKGRAEREGEPPSAPRAAATGKGKAEERVPLPTPLSPSARLCRRARRPPSCYSRAVTSAFARTASPPSTARSALIQQGDFCYFDHES
jgi:hypothetical protein